MRLLRRGAGWAKTSIRGGAYTLGLIACAGQATDDPLASVQGDLTAVEPGAEASGSESICDALLGRLQAVLLAQVNERAEQARNSGDIYYGGGVFIDDVVPTFSGAVPAPAAETLSIAPSGLSGRPAPAPALEDGDFVKADGDRIYLLHGGTLFVLNAWPANATTVLASIPLEGEPSELHVQDGTLAVLSRIYGPLPGTPDSVSPYYSPTFSKVTLLDASGDTPEVVREAYFEGDGFSSRRAGNVVHAVVQQYSKAQLDYPSVSYVDIFGKPRSQTEIDLQVDLWALLATESIEDSRIEDYLPASYVRVDGDLIRQPLDCSAALLPGGTLTQAGNTSIVSFDLEDPTGPLGKLSFLGYAETVYINADAVVLSQVDYQDYQNPLPTVSTNLHLFALDGIDAEYSASGRVGGYASSQNAIDESGGVVRVATSEDVYTTTGEPGAEVINYIGTESRVYTLEADDGVLGELGRSPALGPQASLVGTRFVGNRAYVTTAGADYRVHVVDLSDPAAPRLGGNVSIGGYGYTLIPLAGQRLLSVGDQYDPVTYEQNLTLQLLDVSDADAPEVAHEYVYPAGTYSDAVYDPRAVSFHPSAGIFALPIQNVGSNSLDVLELSENSGFTRLGAAAPGQPELELEQCLALLGYPTDPESIARLQEEPEFLESLLVQCTQYYPTVRRALFRDDFLFAISNQSVSAHALDTLDGPPLSQVDLPPPVYSSSPGVPLPLTPPPAIEGEAGAASGSSE